MKKKEYILPTKNFVILLLIIYYLEIDVININNNFIYFKRFYMRKFSDLISILIIQIIF